MEINTCFITRTNKIHLSALSTSADNHVISRNLGSYLGMPISIRKLISSYCIMSDSNNTAPLKLGVLWLNPKCIYSEVRPTEFNSTAFFVSMLKIAALGRNYILCGQDALSQWLPFCCKMTAKLSDLPGRNSYF